HTYSNRLKARAVLCQAELFSFCQSARASNESRCRLALRKRPGGIWLRIIVVFSVHVLGGDDRHEPVQSIFRGCVRNTVKENLHVMAATLGKSYNPAFPKSQVWLEGIVVPVRFAPSDPVTRLQAPKLSAGQSYQD